MKKCTYCDKEFTWNKAPNGKWRPYIDGVMHNCQSFWLSNGDYISIDISDELSEKLAVEKAEEESRCDACSGNGCGNCGGTGSLDLDDFGEPTVDKEREEPDASN